MSIGGEKMKAVKCPICWGTGRSYFYFDTCRGCNGKGWVEVHEDKTEIYKPKDYPIIFDDSVTITWIYGYSTPTTVLPKIRGTYS